MTDKQRIRAEIERKLKRHEEIYSHSQLQGHVAACEGVLRELLSFIDSMQEEHASEDFDDEMRKYLLAYKGYPHVMDETEWEIKKACIHFANWQKEQLMKDAIDATVGSIDGYIIRFCSGDVSKIRDKIKVGGDCVKLIIIKESL